MVKTTNANIASKKETSTLLVHTEMVDVIDMHFFAMEGFNQYAAINGKLNWARFWSKDYSDFLLMLEK